MSGGAGARVRLGVVGLGTVAQAVHLPLLARHRDRFQVTAICDLSAERMGVVAERFGLAGAARCPSATELLDSGRVDAVLVLSSGSHGEVAGAALGRGLPVLCEKPLAYTLAEADELARAADRTGAPLQLGYMKLYDPAVRRAARELAAAGGLRSVEVTVLHPSGASQLGHAGLADPPDDVLPATLEALEETTDRLRAVALGPAPAELGRLYTEVLLGSVVHDLAVVRALAGEPERVVHVDAWPEGGWASVVVEAVGPGGVRFGLRWHYLEDHPEYREEVRVHHARGSLTLAFPSPYLLHAPTELTVTGRDGDAVRVRTDRSTVEAFEEELLAFSRLVTGGERPAAGIAEGRADILTCQRIVRRLAAGRGMALAGEAARA